jgi:hypothetical protein
MKTTLLIFLAILSHVSHISNAQSTESKTLSGVYTTLQDYENAHLSYPIHCGSSDGKIKLNHFFSKDYIEIIEGNEKIKLKKDSIFGYRDCKNKSYRFYKSNDEEYLIAENKSIVIYTYEVSVVSSSGKTARLVPAYYFSTSLNSEIHPLSVLNIKKAFPDNLKLHDLLDIEFHGMKDISAYDSVHQMFKVNFLISCSTTNKKQ